MVNAVEWKDISSEATDKKKHRRKQKVSKVISSFEIL